MIYLSIGSNLGNRLLNLHKAVRLLKESYFSTLQTSIILETPAIMPNGAPAAEWDKPYLNMVVRGESAITPEALLAGVKKIETELGRPAVYEKWAPRIMDIDIILWDDVTLITPSLSIPHPELFNRPFLVHLIAMLDPNYRCQFTKTSPAIFSVHPKTFGEIAHSMPDITMAYRKSFALYPLLVGIVNITPDSFSDGGLHAKSEAAIARAKQLVSEGAAVVELGPQSTRPSAVLVDSTAEYSRLAPVLEGLSDLIKTREISISLDSFLPETIVKALEHYSIDWINDVTGTLDNQTLMHIAERGLKIVSMHSLTIPPQQNHCLGFDSPPTDSLCRWAEQKIIHLQNCGFHASSIILDPGIGFGKSLYQNLSLLKNIAALKETGCQILVGHSRKSYISAFAHAEPKERDLETIAVSELLARHSVDYLRVHNVINHQRFFTAQQAVYNIT